MHFQNHCVDFLPCLWSYYSVLPWFITRSTINIWGLSLVLTLCKQCRVWVLEYNLTHFHILEDEFIEQTSVVSQLCYLSIATLLVRFKYYHAWMLADAICNLSGLGFNGFSPDGSPRWDLISNVDVIRFEVRLVLACRPFYSVIDLYLQLKLKKLQSQTFV